MLPVISRLWLESKLQIANCKLQIANLNCAKRRLWFDRRLQIAKSKLRGINLQFAICNLQFAIGFLCLFTPAVPAQEAQRIDESARAFIAAASATSSGQMPTATGILLVANRQSLWDAVADRREPTSPEKAVVIDLELLTGIEDKAPVRDAEQNYYEFQAYNYVLTHAHKLPSATLSKYARSDLTFAHLFEEPRKYRGQLIHVEGRLKRLRKFDANRAAVKAGVSNIYEGWIFGDLSFANPYCVIASELPADISPGEDFEQRVAFDGYYFKRYRYKSGDGWRDAPLLIGLTLTSVAKRQAAEPVESPFTGTLLPGFLGVIAATFILGLGLTIWYRRGDRRVQDQLNRKRADSFFEGCDSQE